MPPSPGRSARTPLHEVGEAPDYRFTLANERTFLAWVRTALAMMAAGVAVVPFIPPLVAGVLTVAAVVALVLTVIDLGGG